MRAMISGRPLMRTALAGAAALLVAISGPGAAAPPHHPAAHKAAPANDVNAWLAKCETSASECAIGVSEARASYSTTQAMFHDPNYCVPASDDDSNVLAPKVVAWLKDHPGHKADPVYGGINAALLAMYPCGQ